MPISLITSIILNLGFIVTVTTVALNLNSDKSPIIIIIYGGAWLILNIICTMIFFWKKPKLAKTQGVIILMTFLSLIISIFIVILV